MSQSPEAQDAAPRRKGPSPILGIFLTVFLDLLGFGMFIPDLQLRGKHLAVSYLGAGATPEQIQTLTGISLAAFSFAQLLTAPFLGRLSDKIGRKKILVVTTTLAIIGYLVYANATSFPIVLIARAISGIAAANIGVAFAYVADVTLPKDRAKGLGAVGAAFGLGFVMGPPLGGILLKISHDDQHLLGYVGAALACVNLFYVAFFLRESLASSDAVRKTGFWHDFRLALSDPKMALLLTMFFIINFAFTNLESTYFLLLADKRSVFHLPDDQAKVTGSYLLAFVGVVMAFMQGFVVQRATPKFGEVKLLRYAYIFYAPIFAMIPYAPIWAPALLGILALGICNGLTQPSLSSLISRSAPGAIQGGIFGITQALGAFARCIGPLISSRLMANSPAAPYWLGASLILIPAVAAWFIKMAKDSGSAVAAEVLH